MKKIPFIFSFLIVFNTAYAQSIFEPQETIRNRYTPDTADLDEMSDFQKKYQDENKKRVTIQKELEDIKVRMEKVSPSSVQNNQISQPEKALNSSPIVGSKVDDSSSVVTPNSLRTKKRKPFQHANYSVYQKPLVFGISEKTQDKMQEKTIIPAGSYVKVKILTGVEASANTQTPYPMLLQADYAFTGPNKTKIDMSNCFLMAKTNGDISTERVVGQVDMISCVRNNGKYEERSTQGYLAGEDSTFGIVGQLISKQGQVLAAAIIASLAKGAGDALATAQTTTQVVAGATGAPATATNVTGSTAAFIAGKAFTDSASLVANWYLKYADQLVPSIAVGSGRSIWVVLQRQVQIPSLTNEESEE